MPAMAAVLPLLPAGLAARGVRLRSRQAGDADFLRDVYVAARWEETAVTGWPDAVRLAFLHDQYRLQCAHYDRGYEGAVWGVVEVAGQRVGRLYLWYRGADLHVVDIALLPAFRNRGLGGELLAAVQRQAAELGAAKVTLQVEMHNPALRLYERLGFRRVETAGIHLLLDWIPPAGTPDCGRPSKEPAIPGQA